MRRHYHRECLKHHPDKGGDVVRFNVVYDTFEQLRELVEQGKVASFTVSTTETPTPTRQMGATASTRRATPAAGEKRRHPSYGYFQEAMDAGVPLYVIELAKSGRAMCALGGRCARPMDVDETARATAAKATTTSARGRTRTTRVGKDVSVHARDLHCIAMGTVRIGVIDGISGKYARFVHLKCWRVPSSIWKGLPQPGSDGFDDVDAFVHALRVMNEVVFTGFASLPEDKQREVAEWCMDANHWAKEARRKKLADATTSGTKRGAKIGEVKTEEEHDVGADLAAGGELALVAPPSKKAKKSASASASASAMAVVAKPAPAKWVMPVPGCDGTVAKAFAQKTVVLTGVFPTVGGGMGLNLGKDRMKAVIERFGGKVTSAISGNTDILVVGSQPGATKVEAARKRHKIQLLSFENTMDVIHGRYIEGEKPLVIDSFSAGWQGSGKIYHWGQKRLDAAAGVTHKVTDDAPLALPSSSTASKFPSSAKVTKQSAGQAATASRGKTRVR